MAVFKIVVNDPKSRRSYQIEADQGKAAALIGKKIGDEFDGGIIGLTGYKLEIRGGTDKDGFPMHPALKGQGKKKLLLSNPPGFHPKIKGQRKRKMVRGNVVSSAIVQLNVKVVKSGEKPLEELVPKKAKEGEKEKVKQEKKEKPKAEEKPKVEETKEVKTGGDESKE